MIASSSYRTPLVEGLSYSEILTVWEDYLDVTYFMSGDLFGGYETNLFQLQNRRDEE
jgi:hypothetical protein